MANEQLHCTVAEAKQRMSYAEFRRRFAYECIEPTGETRQDIRMAMLCELLATAVWAHAGGKGTRPDLDDFIIDWWGDRAGKPKQTPQEQRDAILVSLGLDDHLAKFYRE